MRRSDVGRVVVPLEEVVVTALGHLQGTPLLCPVSQTGWDLPEHLNKQDRLKPVSRTVHEGLTLKLIYVILSQMYI